MIRSMLSIFLIVCSLSAYSQIRPGLDPGMETLVNSALARAGDNAGELKEALRKAPQNQLKGVAYLIAYMVPKDLQTLTSSFILENADWAYKARATFPWCNNLPEEIFLNEVLPFASLQEERDRWRPDFYRRFEPYVHECRDIYAAIDSVNRNIRDELLVDYNTKRSRVDISPFQAIKEKMATCTGLSFLLIDAFRAVGIPARLAGTMMWTNMRGNHSWVEVWIGGKWYFTEYYPDSLNKSWFVADAGRADPEKPIHWIYAVSFKPGDCYFPMSWERNDSIIHAVNVTGRYITLYEEQLKDGELKDNEVLAGVVLYRDQSAGQESSGRIHRRISVLDGDKELTFGYSPSPTEDLNKFLTLKLVKNATLIFRIYGTDGKPEKEIKKYVSGESDQVIRLFLE